MKKSNVSTCELEVSNFDVKTMSAFIFDVEDLYNDEYFTREEKNLTQKEPRKTRTKKRNE